MELRIERATKRHARMVGRKMRKEDADEVWASGHFLPEQACRASINQATEAWALLTTTDEILGVFGVTIVKDFAVPWALTTNAVDKYPHAFWKVSNVVVAAWAKKYPIMLNMVDIRHQKALRWLTRLGFVTSPAVPWGAEGRMFVKAVLDSREEVARV